MAMTSGNPAGMSSEINVTPMIDVLLVLLIIFMVIVPSVPKGEFAAIPKPAQSAKPDGDAVVLELQKVAGGSIAFRINRQGVAREDLAARLAAIYVARGDRVLFVKGDDGLSFSEIAQVIDIGHAAGVERVGLVTPGLSAAM
jgi:biopolymer transport protein ExbD